LNGWPNTPDTYMDPDFYEEIRTWNGAASVDAALRDPENVCTYKRFISYCRFYWDDSEGTLPQPWFRDDGQFAGGQYVSTFGPTAFLLPTPEKWTQRGVNYVANCQWNGWTNADVAYRLEGRGQHFEDVQTDQYGGALDATSYSVTQMYGPFGTVTYDADKNYQSSTGQSITVNGRAVTVDVTPSVESGRPRSVCHINGGGTADDRFTLTTNTNVLPSETEVELPSWFKIGSLE
jgi:hypothetical protein